MVGNNERTPGDAAPTDEHLRPGLAMLWRAYAYAQDAGAEPWEFALEIDELYKSGLLISDLRWLVVKGLAQHGQETSTYGDLHRSFRRSGGLNFGPATCLVLTPRGATFAGNVVNELALFGSSTWSIDNELTATGLIGTASVARGRTTERQTDSTTADETDGLQEILKPHWNSEQRELRLADTIVKRFRVPARNQEMILSAFQEEDWPPHIDDPLPASGDIDPRTRLHDAIYRLNHRQTNGLLRFHGNGTADGVLWEQL